MERTLVLIKPDAVQRGLVGRILDRFEQRGLSIRAAKLLDGRPELAERHYAEHARSRSSASSSSSSRPPRRWRSCWRARARSPSCARRWGRRTRRALRPAPFRGDFALVDAGQPRPRLGLAGVGRARDRALVRRPMSSSDGLTEHARRNRAAWDADAANWVQPGERAWAEHEPSWGIWGIPESRAWRAARRRREGRDRARLRHRLLVGVARAPRRPRGRARQLRAPARDRSARFRASTASSSR